MRACWGAAHRHNNRPRARRADQLYDRDGGPYLRPGWRLAWDNPERFAALCPGSAAEVAAREWQGADGWKPDILHAHDWQAGWRRPTCTMAAAVV
jgi:glycogen synthase